MPNTDFLDVSEIIDTFDADEARTMIHSQLELLDNDACEIMTDNFKMLYKRYANLRNARDSIGEDIFLDAEERFLTICEIFIDEISKKLGFSMNQDYLDENRAVLPAIVLPLYLFFIMDLRSNIYNVLISFIAKNRDDIIEAFKERQNKHDVVTTSNGKTIEDVGTAIIVSNIYDVIDYCMRDMTAEVYMENIEKGYIAYKPIHDMMADDNLLDMDNFVDNLRDVLKQNVALKARIGFDIICRLKGFTL